jgi:hypothetical protein
LFVALSWPCHGVAAGDVVWQAMLSLVLMNPKKSKGGKKVSAASAAYRGMFATAQELRAAWAVAVQHTAAAAWGGALLHKQEPARERLL